MKACVWSGTSQHGTMKKLKGHFHKPRCLPTDSGIPFASPCSPALLTFPLFSVPLSINILAPWDKLSAVLLHNKQWFALEWTQ